MGHPLTPDLTKMSMEELTNKISELQKRLTYAFRIGQSDMVGQLQLLMQDYNAEMQERNRRQLEEMEKHSKQFKNIIDIQ
jgi:hypothetical protein